VIGPGRTTKVSLRKGRDRVIGEEVVADCNNVRMRLQMIMWTTKMTVLGSRRRGKTIRSRNKERRKR
jgi:hypothetical protein